jgi:hypothetical protein
MRKKAITKKHTVRCEVKIPQLTKAGTSVEFQIYAEGEKIGTIVLGRGSLTWYGGKRQTGREFSWSRFAELMDEQAYA